MVDFEQFRCCCILPYDQPSSRSRMIFGPNPLSPIFLFFEVNYFLIGCLGWLFLDCS